MSTHVDPNGRRSVTSQAIVPGTPEQVWQAIATGPGVSSWFVPCTIDEKVGGKIVASFGPGMDSEATITAWNPPHSFDAEGSEMTPGGPVMATEWTVEAQSGGNCLVRVVHSWFAETDEWDSQFEGTEHGWPAFFRDLALYLVHFFGQPSATFQLMAMSTNSQDDVWGRLSSRLGFGPVGTSVSSDVPPVAGIVEYVGPDHHPECLIRKDNGIAHFLAIPMGGMTCISIRFFLFGDGAAESAAGQEREWSAWIAEIFPMPAVG